MKTSSFPIRLTLLAASFILHPSSFLFAQGSLTPPGPPVATMKTLAQIEPRIDLQNAPAAAVTTTDASYHYIITQPGSYYLSANLGVTKTHGIQINAAGVTLDLSGFEILRAGGPGGNGIEIPATSHRASVRNGSLKGFAYGINSIFFGGYAKSCAFRDLAVSACTTVGMVAGDGAVLESCRANNNSGTYGINASAGSTLNNCSAFQNTATYGIFANFGSTLGNCSAYNNTSATSFSSGIAVGAACTLSHCNASNNLSTAATITSTTGMGFYVFGGNSTIQSCTALNNRGDGVCTDSGSSILDCTVSSNSGAGIRATDGCTVTRCTLRSNVGYGLYAEADCAVSQCVAKSTTGTGVGLRVGSNSSVTGCTASANTTDGIQLTTRCHAANNSVSGNTGNGIYATGALNRIDGNHATSNTGAGIRSDGTDFTVRNSVNNNTGGNLVPGPGGNVAPLQQAFSATNPWANLQ